MAIDSRIALGVRPMADPMQAYGQALSLKSLMGQQQMQQMQMQAMQQERADQLALRDLMRQPGTDDERIDRLMQAGHIQPALQLRKHALDSRKTNAEIEKTTLEAGAMAAKQFADAMAGVNSQESYQAVVASLARNPAFGPMVQNLPGQWTPEFGQQAVRQAMIAHGKIAETLAKFENRDVGGSIQTVRRDPITGVEQVVGAVDKTATPGDLMTDARVRAEGAANRGVTMRGQDKADARAAQQIALQREAIGTGKAPAGYRIGPDGLSLEFIPGGPADPALKAPTEFQGKSGAFGDRAEKADAIIRELEGKYSPAFINSKQALGKVWGVGGALEAGANLLLPAEAQRVEQAQRDFVNAVLRQESGAAISESEFANAQRQYFPQPGDSAAVIAQKAANRKTAIEGFRQNAGPAHRARQAQPDNSGATGGWSIQRIE